MFCLGTVQLWASAAKFPLVDECSPAGSLPALLQPSCQFLQQQHGEMGGWWGGISPSIMYTSMSS